MEQICLLYTISIVTYPFQIYTFIHACIHTDIHTYTYLPTYPYTYIHPYKYRHTYTYTKKDRLSERAVAFLLLCECLGKFRQGFLKELWGGARDGMMKLGRRSRWDVRIVNKDGEGRFGVVSMSSMISRRME